MSESIFIIKLPPINRNKILSLQFIIRIFTLNKKKLILSLSKFNSVIHFNDLNARNFELPTLSVV